MRVVKLCCSVLCILWCTVVGVAAGDLAAETVVSVNGVELTLGELNQEVQSVAPLETSFHGGMSEEKIRDIQKKALDALIEKELQYQDGIRKGVRLDADTLEQNLRQVESRYPSAAEFRKAIAAAGFTEKSLARYLERAEVAGLMRRREVDDKAQVSDAVVRRQYDDNRQKYLKPVAYRASHILVKVDPSSNAEQKAALRAKAMELLKRLNDGAPFAPLAETDSDDMSRIKGGDLGYFHAGTTEAEFDEAVKEMKVGELRGPIETIYGFHIIKLTDKKDAAQLSYEEVKDKLRMQLVGEEKKRLFSQWMKSLRDAAKIVYPAKKATP